MSWRGLGRVLGHLGPSWRRLDGILGRLEASWAVLEASWRHLRPIKPMGDTRDAWVRRIRVGL